jgi:tRNA threonylcarbamoyl adenosine modification protein YeaZ
VWQDGRVLAEITEDMQRGQDARLMPIVVDALAKAGKAFSDLNRIAVTRGPGSFTGIRVGLAAARGIALAAHKPIIGIDRFAIYRALHATPEQNLLVVIESRREELFCKFYPAGDAAHEAALMTRPQIDAFIAVHPNTRIAGDIATPQDNMVATCAQLAASADPKDSAFAPLPLYLRAPDVNMSGIGPISASSR